MNTPYFRGSNEENAMATSPLAPPNTIHATPNRRVLGDVSTNPKVYSSPATGGMFSIKALKMGSPLKRSFTAAVEDGYGLKYLKRRRMSGEMGFGPVEPKVQKARRDDDAAGSRARSVPEPMVTHSEPADELPQLPTHPDTPSDSGGETHESFESLINFDPALQQMSVPHPSQHPQEQPHFHFDHPQLPPPPHYPPPQQQERPSGTGLIFPTVSHAETLRLRLQVAMYKIRTNQVNVPFAQLQIEHDQRAEEMNRHRVNAAVEEAVATMRREAMDNMPRDDYPPPTLMPAPVLFPTAYSSRTIQQPDPHDLGPLAAASLYMHDQQTQGSNMMPDM